MLGKKTKKAITNGFGHGRTRPYPRYYPPGTTYARKLGTRAEHFPFPIFLSYLSFSFGSSHKTENDLVIITRSDTSFSHFFLFMLITHLSLLGLVKFALDNGQPIDSVVNGVYAIHAACCNNNVAVVLYLIEHGADVNARRLPRKYSPEKGV